MTEQTDTPVNSPEAAPAGAADGIPGEPAPAAAKPPRRALRAALRWTAAVLVCGGLGTGTALGITSMERTDVPGLATEHDGRWTYPELALPALPKDAPRPFTEGNDAEIHHADLRQLLLPAPEGATVDKKADGGRTTPEEFVQGYEKEEQADIRQALADSALRRITTRAWTMPDGTRTRIQLLQFSSVAYSQAFVDDTLRPGGGGGPSLSGVGTGRLDVDASGAVEVAFTDVRSYTEIAPYGPAQTSWSYVLAGDTLALITQTRGKEVLTVPYHQTVILQSQLLG